MVGFVEAHLLLASMRPSNHDQAAQAADERTDQNLRR
jgi:hypothetical protein